MIVEKYGDIFSTSARAIGHGCNAQGKMGSGIARMIKERYPPVYSAYKTAIVDKSLRLGGIQIVKTSPHYIINLVIQQGFGPPPWKGGRTWAVLHHIESTLAKLCAQYKTGVITSIALPRLGCGSGGLYWDEEDYTEKSKYWHKVLDRPQRKWVKDIFYDVFYESPMKVEVWELKTQ